MAIIKYIVHKKKISFSFVFARNIIFNKFIIYASICWQR